MRRLGARSSLGLEWTSSCHGKPIIETFSGRALTRFMHTFVRASRKSGRELREGVGETDGFKLS